MPVTVILRANCNPLLRTVIEAPAELITEINTRMAAEFQFVTERIPNGKASFQNSNRASTATTIDAIKACRCKLAHFTSVIIKGQYASSEVCVFEYYGSHE
jgi:hypothetical protein